MDMDIEIIKSDLATLKADVAEIKKLITELHAIQTGKLYNPQKEKRLSKKEREMQELLQLRKDLHIKWLNKDYRPKK